MFIVSNTNLIVKEIAVLYLTLKQISDNIRPGNKCADTAPDIRQDYYHKRFQKSVFIKSF